MLLDVTPLSLGIETEGGVMTKLVERNTTIPVTKDQVFSTAADNQTAVTVRVFQGERQMAADNRLLGQFNLEELPPAPRGVPQIKVVFDIDVNGILNVSAKDVATGKETSVKIEQSSGLSEAEIEEMQRQAESHADEDKKKKELAEAKNNGSRIVYDVEKLLKEHAEKIDDSSKSAIEASVKKVNDALETEDAAAITSACEELQQATHAFTEQMYKESQAAGGEGATAEGGDTSAPPADEEDVIDAEFEKKD